MSITGDENTSTEKAKADVIVVLDLSASMSRQINSESVAWGNNRSRLYYAKSALDTLSNTLLKNNSDDSVQMSLITFSTNVVNTYNFTPSASKFQGYYSSASTSGGTNWEAALEKANTMPVHSDAATYVIFVTDGDPTFRKSRTNLTDTQLRRTVYTDSNNNNYNEVKFYDDYSVYGTGNNDYYSANYNSALTQAKSILSHNKNFYTIGIGPAVSTLQKFTTDAGVASDDHYFSARSNDDLEKAFTSIASSITTKLGYGDVRVTDGITSLTNLLGKVSGTAGNFSYSWTKTEDETAVAFPDNLKTATFDSSSGAVTWNFPENYQLEDGVTYTVSFVVWPSQEALDHVAKLNNGTEDWDTLDQTVKDQIERTGPEENYTYTLKTNTSNANVKVKESTSVGGSSSTSGEDKTVDFGTVPGLDLSKHQLVVKKVFDGEDTDDNKSVKLQLLGDNAAFSNAFTIGNNESHTVYISPGFIRNSQILENGHDFTLTESGDHAYHWDLEADTYHPMIVDGSLTMYKLDDSNGTLKIGEHKYSALSGDAATTLTATNHRRSNLNVTKAVVDSDGNAVSQNPDDLFSFSIKVDVPEGSSRTDQTLWFSVEKATNTFATSSDGLEVSSPATASTSDNYYTVTSGQTFTVKMKAGWNLRFTNTPTGTRYTVTETTIPDGYEFYNASESDGTNTITEGVTVDSSAHSITGSVATYNKSYTAIIANKQITTSIYIKKTDTSGTPLSGAKFQLYSVTGNGSTNVTKYGDEFTITEDEKQNGHLVDKLSVGDYKLVETKAPDGYIVENTDSYFNVAINNGSAVVTMTNDSTKTNSMVSAAGNTVTVQNKAGQALPSTGGHGTLPFVLGGMFLISAAGVFYIISKKRSVLN